MVFNKKKEKKNNCMRLNSNSTCHFRNKEINEMKEKKKEKKGNINKN